MNLEFNFEQTQVVFFAEELSTKSRAIHERALARAARYLVSEAELLESIIEADQDKLYEKFGLSFLTTYCVKHLGLDETVAGVLVRVARKSQAVPGLKQAVVNGDISISNARTIASVITNENQAEWIGKAKTLSKNKLEREVATVCPAKAKPEKARRIGNGRVQVVLSLSEEEYEERCRITDLVSRSLGKSATDSDVEVEMMKVYSYHRDPVSKAERAAERAAKGDLKRAADIEAKSGAKSAAKRVEKQKSIKTATSQGVPSKKSATNPQTTPAEVTHAVNLRDRGCCRAKLADGTECGETRWTDHHHMIPRWRGGKDAIENIITLCSAHHRLWHRREGL